MSICDLKTGIKEKRNYVRNYYQLETNVITLLCIDDDMIDIMDYDTPLNGEGFREIVNMGFAECLKANCYLWGVSPFHNTFFLQKKVSTNLKYICGAFFGLIINRELPPLQTSIDHGEDFEFTCEHFIRDNAVVRLNWIALKTKYFNPKGGITEWYGGKDGRKVAQEKNCKWLQEKYGSKMVRLIVKKYGYDVRLNGYYKNPVKE